MAKRRITPNGELGCRLAEREIELGLTREGAVRRIRQLTDDKSLALGTYIGWLRGTPPSKPFYSPLAEHLGVGGPTILEWLGLLTTEQAEQLTRAKGVYVSSGPVNVAA